MKGAAGERIFNSGRGGKGRSGEMWENSQVDLRWLE